MKEPKMIIKLRTDNQEFINNFTEKLITQNIAIIPEDIKILIKDKEGYWEEK